MSAAEYAILKKMEQVSVPLKAWLGDGKINYGIKTGFNKAFFIDEDTRARLIAEDPKSAELIKPLVIGEDIKRYEIEYKGRYLIWTYVGVPIEDYPAIFNHLKQFQPELEKRWDKGDHWWELRHCDYYADFEKPKIIYPVIARENTFGFDTNGFFSNDKTFIVPNADYFCLALLNSALGFLWARNILSALRGGFLEYRAQSMVKFPIHRIAFTTPKEERARLVEEGKRLYQEFLGTKDPIPILDLVERCLPKDDEGNFSQAEEKSDVVHDLLAFLAERMIELNREKQEKVKEFLEWLEAELEVKPDKKGDTGIDALAGKTKLRNFLGDYQKGEEALPFDELWAILRGNKNRIKRNLSPAFMHDVKQAYEESLTDLIPIKERLRLTDALIDQIVYRLYGLTEEEIGIVEEQG